MQFIETFINSIILWTTAVLVGRILLEEKQKPKYILVTIIIIIFSIILSVLNMQNFNTISGPIKVVLVYALQCIFYKAVFKKPVSTSILLALIWYICLFLSEVIVILFTSIITIFTKSSMSFIINNIVVNLLIVVSNLAIIKVFKSKLVTMIKNENVIKKSTIIVIITILITLALLLFKIPYDEWEFNLEFIITMLIIIGFCIVGLTLLKQKAQIQETTSKYLQLANYSDVTNDLLEDYRIVAHEHKNQLSVIRSMANPNDKELIDYIDDLLEKRDKIRYSWLGQLNHLPISGLKGLINYKLMEMEQKKLNINITVSKEVMKTKLRDLSLQEKDKLYSIIGVYLDNMIQAAENSSKKEVSIEIYKEKNDIVFLLANSYSGKIDLEKLDSYGYTTKGKNHGVGLHIVKKIMEEEAIFSQSRSILDDYYIQELRIHLNEINKNKEAA